METIYYLIQGTLPVAIPLLLVALGGMFSERSGVINIGLEGIMLTGAFLGCVFVYLIEGSGMNAQLMLILAMIVAAAAGIIYSFMLAFAAINMKADQTIVGTAMNMLIPAAILLFAKMKLGSDGVTTSVFFYVREVPGLSKIPVIGDLFFKNTYITVYIGLVLLAVAVVVFYKTRFGLRLRACGEHPSAADSVGINVEKMRWAGVTISGFLGGIGGFAYIVPSVTTWNFEVGVAGAGFLALAVMIFGQWKPFHIAGAAANIADSTVLSHLGLSKNIYSMMPFIASMIILAFTSKNSQAPKAEGIPYDKGAR